MIQPAAISSTRSNLTRRGEFEGERDAIEVVTDLCDGGNVLWRQHEIL